MLVAQLFLPFMQDSGSVQAPGIGFTPYSRVGQVTSYCDVGYTASGLWTRWGLAGGDYWLPLGSRVLIQGYGVVTIADRGAPGITDIDIAAPGDCSWSWQWGRQWRRLTVLRWGW